MKKRILSLALTLCLCLALMPAASAAEDLGEMTRAEAEERFGITISPDHIDFGTVPEQSGEYMHEQTITLTNGYDKTIRVNSVKFSPASEGTDHFGTYWGAIWATDSCFRATPPSFKSSLPPGIPAPALSRSASSLVWMPVMMAPAPTSL